MNTKFFTSIVTIFFLLCSSTASICLEKEYITEEDIWTSNINDKAINKLNNSFIYCLLFFFFPHTIIPFFSNNSQILSNIY